MIQYLLVQACRFPLGGASRTHERPCKRDGQSRGYFGKGNAGDTGIRASILDFQIFLILEQSIPEFSAHKFLPPSMFAGSRTGCREAMHD